MTATINPSVWLDFIEREYLRSFIANGGASIKFVVPADEAMRATTTRDILQRAASAGFLTASISAHETRVHMIDQLFFRIAQQIPWRELSEQVNRALAMGNGYAPPRDGSAPFVQRLADANDIEPEFILIEARRWIASILKESSLAKEFRVAMMQLCRATLTGGPEGETTYEVVTDWLTGRNRAISAVKPYQIFTRISRGNARYLLTSLLHWIRLAGFRGLVVTLDLSRLSVARNPRDGQPFYTKAQLFDAYEVLRQFIDSTDQLRSCFIVVLPAQEFLDPDTAGRGMAIYNALKLRVYDEVHDQRLVNPMGALVRVDHQGFMA